jgi:hypothetical protein
MLRRLAVSEFPNDNPELHDGLVWACPAPCAPALPTLRLREGGPVRVLKPGWEPATPIAPAVALESLVSAHEPETELAEPVPVAESVAVPDRNLEVASVVMDAPVAETEPSVAFQEDDIDAPDVAPAEPMLAVTAEPPEPEPAEAGPSGFEAFVAALSALLVERGATRAAANVGALLGRTRLARDAFDAPTRKTLVARGFLDAKTARPTPEFSVVAHAWRDVLDGANGDLSACGSMTLDVWGADIVAALIGSPRERTDDIRRALRQRGVAAFGMLAAA